MANLAKRSKDMNTESGDAAKKEDAVKGTPKIVSTTPSGKSVLTEETTAQKVVQYLQQLGDEFSTTPDADAVFDALAVAMAIERLDPILTRIRGRAQIIRLLAQMSRATYLVTWLAETLGIEFDGSPVEADENFGNWDNDRITKLAALITSEASILKNSAFESRELLKAAVAKSEADSATIRKLTEDINEERTKADARVQVHVESCLRYTSMLATYKDIPRFVVARVDPTTGDVQSYLKTEEDALKGVKNFGAATRFDTFAEANDLRIEAIRLRRGKVAKNLRSAVASQYCVLQVAVRSVDLQTVIDESPDEDEDDE